VQLRYQTAPDVGAVRDVLAKAGFSGSVVTTIGKREENEIYVRVPLVQGAKDEDLAPSVVKALQAAQGANPLTVRSQSYIGPTIGKELVKKALGAILGSMAGMLIYISSSSGGWPPSSPSFTTRSSRWGCSRSSATR
jgi:preprotein translocase subunit SecF